MSTSQPNHDPEGSDDLDTLLSAAYTRLVNDLTAAFDLDAGAAQATHPATYSALTDDLAQHLNLDAGLAAILTGGSPTPPNATQPASRHPTMDQAQDLEHLRFLDAPTRLALRSDAAFHRLRDTLELVKLIARAQDLAEQSQRHPTLPFDVPFAHALDVPLASALDLARTLARARIFDVARALARDLTRAGAVARDFAPDLAALNPDLAARVRDLTYELDFARSRDPDLDRDLERDLVHALKLDPDFDLARRLVVRLAFKLHRDLARARDLAVNLARSRDPEPDPAARVRDLAFAPDLAARARRRALNLVHDLDLASRADILILGHAPDPDPGRSIGDAFRSALAVALDLTHHAASGYSRILGLRLDLGQGDRIDQSAVTRARMALAKVGDDFVGADLRSAQMHSGIVGLVGVRWSTDTRWPSEWVDYVRACSDEIEPGLFQITRTDGRHSSTYATT